MKDLPVLNVFEILAKEKYKDSNIQYNSKHTWKYLSEKSCDLEFEVKAKSFTELYHLLVPCKKNKKFQCMVIAQMWKFTHLGSCSIKFHYLFRELMLGNLFSCFLASSEVQFLLSSPARRICLVPFVADTHHPPLTFLMNSRSGLHLTCVSYVCSSWLHVVTHFLSGLNA